MTLYDISFVTRNVFELATPAMTGTADTGFPESRLTDRAISLFWKVTAAATPYYFTVTTPASEIVNFLAVHRHNFAGEDITWDHGAGNTLFEAAYTVPAGNAQIVRTVDPFQIATQFRFGVSSIENPRCGEIFMGYVRSYEALLESPPTEETVPNVARVQTLGRNTRAVKRGYAPRARSYTLSLSAANLAIFEGQMDSLDEYSKNFWFRDHRGDYFCAYFGQVPSITPINDDRFGVTFTVQEEQ